MTNSISDDVVRTQQTVRFGGQLLPAVSDVLTRGTEQNGRDMARWVNRRPRSVWNGMKARAKKPRAVPAVLGPDPGLRTAAARSVVTLVRNKGAGLLAGSTPRIWDGCRDVRRKIDSDHSHHPGRDLRKTGQLPLRQET
jgi:hypothetical protein